MSFLQGLVHPLGGWDHIAVMVAVGVFAAQHGARALWLVPASFLALVAGGAALASAGYGLAFVEAGIGASLALLAVLIVLRPRLAALPAATLVGVFALFHGHAHGTEMPIGASVWAYAAGFVTASAALHLLGVALARLLLERSERSLQGPYHPRGLER